MAMFIGHQEVLLCLFLNPPQVKCGAVLNREDYAEAIADLSRQVKDIQSRTVAPQPPAIPSSGSQPTAGKQGCK
jgi:hypothetical protein